MKPETVEKIAAMAEQAAAKLAREATIFACDALSIILTEQQPFVVIASDDEGMTVAEAATEIGVSRWRVYEMIRQNILPAYKPSPKTYRLRRGAVREFVRTGACAAITQDKAKVLQLRREAVIESVASTPKKEAQKG